MIRFKTLTREEARKILTEYDNYSDVEFQDLVEHWKKHDPVSEFEESFSDFRKELLNVFKSALEETNGKMTYLLDLRVGLKIYELLPLCKNFTLVQANDDDIWRYISVKVMPDITYLRYPDPEKEVLKSNLQVAGGTNANSDNNDSGADNDFENCSRGKEIREWRNYV